MCKVVREQITVSKKLHLNYTRYIYIQIHISQALVEYFLQLLKSKLFFPLLIAQSQSHRSKKTKLCDSKISVNLSFATYNPFAAKSLATNTNISCHIRRAYTNEYTTISNEIPNQKATHILTIVCVICAFRSLRMNCQKKRILFCYRLLHYFSNLYVSLDYGFCSTIFCTYRTTAKSFLYIYHEAR